MEDQDPQAKEKRKQLLTELKELKDAGLLTEEVYINKIQEVLELKLGL